jgi:hypothetical protein
MADTLTNPIKAVATHTARALTARLLASGTHVNLVFVGSEQVVQALPLQRQLGMFERDLGPRPSAWPSTTSGHGSVTFPNFQLAERCG